MQIEVGPRARGNAAAGTTAREDVVTVLAGIWLIVGLFLDGYAHQHLVAGTESFATPWHAVFYAGFVACAAWTARLIRVRGGRFWSWRVPPGYGPAVAGLGLFAVGGAGDLAWHSFFGVEVGIDALLSPTHLVLMLALLSIVTAPYRAALSATISGARRRVAMVALGAGTALVAFFVNFAWGLGDGGFRVAYDPLTGAGETHVIAGVASVLVTTGVFVGAALFALRLGSPPKGTFTILFGLASLAVHLAFDEEWTGVVAAVVGGAVLDAVLSGGLSRARIRLGLAGATTVVWSVYYGTASLLDVVAWPPEVWVGAVVISALCAAGVATLATDPPPSERGSTFTRMQAHAAEHASTT